MQDTIGIDISKDTVDVHRLSDGKHRQFDNDKAGLRALCRWIGNSPFRVVYEATGRYHRDLEGTLGMAGHALAKVNPNRTRKFAQAISQGAKTDRVDAAMLARMGAVLDLDAKPARTDSMHEIRELHVARIGLIKDRTACRNRLHGARNKVVLAQLRARLRQVEKQIDQIDLELQRLVTKDLGVSVDSLRYLKRETAFARVTAEIKRFFREHPECEEIYARIQACPMADTRGCLKRSFEQRAAKSGSEPFAVIPSLMASLSCRSNPPLRDYAGLFHQCRGGYVESFN